MLTFICISEYANASSSHLFSHDLLTDGDNLLTYDANTGLDWLDLSQTQGQSYNSILGGYGDFVTTHGFTVASEQNIIDLFHGVGLINEWSYIPEYVPGAMALGENLSFTTNYFNGISTIFQGHGMYSHNVPTSSGPAVAS